MSVPPFPSSAMLRILLCQTLAWEEDHPIGGSLKARTRRLRRAHLALVLQAVAEVDSARFTSRPISCERKKTAYL